MNRRAAEQAGRKAEALAALWLRLFGWRILAQRVRTPVGEIDLIARRWRTLAFVEVKARPTLAEAEAALDDHRLRRVVRAAEALTARYAGPRDTVRIDAVLIAPGRLPSHRKHVWQGR